MSLPLARVSLSVKRPETSLNRFGLGDLYVEPVKLGWRLPHVDVVGSYAFYAPVRRTDPGGASRLGSPEWSHELSAGGALFFTSDRSLHLSVLASYQLYQRKLAIDVTRGDTLQLQGGVGGRLLKIVDVGVAGYALWQVTDNRGANLPEVLRGPRERVYRAGQDVLVKIPRTGLAIDLRYEHDFGARARPLGQICVVSVAWASSGK